MAGRYIPPALRKKLGETTTSVEPPQETRSPSPIDTRKQDSTLFTERELSVHFRPEHEDGQIDELPFTPLRRTSTLNSSTASPDQLAWIKLFQGANPRWASDRIIFVKTNLDLLPTLSPSESSIDDDSAKQSLPSSENSGGQRERQEQQHPSKSVATESKDPVSMAMPTLSEPVAVFEQIRRGTHNFHFGSWYRVNQVQYLKPQSQELIRMLSLKWEYKDRRGHVQQRQRDEKGWQESLKHRWAVIQMVRDEEAGRDRGGPAVERREEDAPEMERPGKQR